MRLESCVDVYLSHLRVERGLAPKSVEAYGSDLARFVRYCEERGANDPGAVDRGVVSNYMVALAR